MAPKLGRRDCTLIRADRMASVCDEGISLALPAKIVEVSEEGWVITENK